MISPRELKRHFYNIKIFNAYSAFELVKQSIMFPLDYFLKNGSASYPLNILFSITSRCNAKCAICKVKQILKNEQESEPTLEKIEIFLKSIGGVKPSFLLYGGEPFMRNDIVEIVSLFKRLGFSCGIFTNGTLLNKEMAFKLKSLSLDYIVFSIQGWEKTHDKIVGMDGAYKKLTENMDCFLSPRSSTKIIANITLSEQTIGDLSDLESLVKFLVDKKIDLIRFGHLNFLTAKEAEKNKKFCDNSLFGECRSDLGYVYDLNGKEEKFRFAIKKIKSWPFFIRFNPDLEKSEINRWYSKEFKTKRKCYFLWRGLFIQPNGDVFPCESLRYSMGNIYKDGLDKIWNNKKYTGLRRMLKSGLLPACSRCCKL